MTYEIKFTEGRPGEVRDEMTFEYEGASKDDVLKSFWADTISDYTIEVINVKNCDEEKKDSLMKGYPITSR